MSWETASMQPCMPGHARGTGAGQRERTEELRGERHGQEPSVTGGRGKVVNHRVAGSDSNFK